MALDFEGVLKFFRVTLPKKYRSEQAAHRLLDIANKTKVCLCEITHRSAFLMINTRTACELIIPKLTDHVEQWLLTLLSSKAIP